MAVWISKSEEETLHFAEGVAQLCQPGDIVYLNGNLGAGKTLFAKGFCQALQFTGFVHSPSYALINAYESTPPVFHLDLYRIEEGESSDLGLDSYDLEQGFTLVEWPKESMRKQFPPRFEIFFETLGEHERKITLKENS